MCYKKAGSAEVVANYLIECLSSHLRQGESVLWLIPGGSAIAVAVEVSKSLQATDTSKLKISLTDERYGEVGHINSNWRQLSEAGFSLSEAALTPVLAGVDVETTTTRFADYLEKQLSEVDYSVGLFGIGADGHTAGILPHTPAVSCKEYACSYQTPQFSRITMSPHAIGKLNEAVVYAMGIEKHQPLNRLQEDVDIADQPAQVLKQVAKLTIYNDLKGEYS